MSSISIETTNENLLTVEEYVRFIRIKEHIQQLLDCVKIKELLLDSEDSINGLAIDLVVRCSVSREK